MPSFRHSFKLFLCVCCTALVILSAMNLYKENKQQIIISHHPHNREVPQLQHLHELKQAPNHVVAEQPQAQYQPVHYQQPQHQQDDSSVEKIKTSDEVMKPIPKDKEILILDWRHLWDVPSEGLREGIVEEGCRVTYNQSSVKEAAAVVFEYTALDHEQMPWKYYRHPDQVYVWRVAESTASMKNWFKFSFAKFDHLIVNWTMTYRRDSDVFAPYIKPWELVNHVQHGKAGVDKILSRKSRKALWVVSNCAGSAGAKRRMEYVNKLVESGFEVDRFGGCFDNKDDFNSMTQDVRDSYKFYFAFENSMHCRDYITEKFWRNGIIRGSVPVVWGPSKKDVEEMAPHMSYIHTEDFDGPEDLGRYLNYLDSSDSAYRKYFDWMIDYENTRNPSYIQQFTKVEEHLLCDKLRKGGFKRKSIPALGYFWYEMENKECYIK